MYFSSVDAFIAMGGHGFYVWLAVGFSAFWLVCLVIYPVRKQKQLLREIRAQQLIDASRRAVQQAGGAGD